MTAASDIWWRMSKGCYYTTINRKQIRLCKTASQSKIKLQQILRGEQNANAPASGMTFARLADKFLDWSQASNEPETYNNHRTFLQSFRDHVGNRLVSALCEEDLDTWCRQHAKAGAIVNAGGRKGGTRQGVVWSENTQARARAIVLACLNYGVRKLNLPPHPMKHVKPGTVGRRERIVTPEEKAKVRAAVKGPMLDFVTALELTGARPFSEICRVTAADVDLEKGTWTMAKWKNSKKQKGKKRVIYLVPEMMEMTRRLMQQYSEGSLFRGRKEKPYIKQTITARMRALGEKLKIEGLTCYAWRHAAITEALVKGVPVAIVAELYGTSIQTISRSYSHVNQKEDALREAMCRAAGA